MKLSKRVLVVALVGIITLIIGLVGCSSSENKQADPSQSSQSSQQDEKDSSYPTKPVQLIVPYKAGGDTDIFARIVAQNTQKALGNPVVVVNVDGAGGTVATRQVMDADPDGYTVLFMQPNMLLNKITGLVDFSYEKFDGAAISVSTKTTVLAVKGDSPYNDLPALVNDMKNKPGEIRFATQVGGYTHLTALALEKAAGAKLKKIDVGGNSDQVAALLGGHVDVMTMEYGIGKDYIESGKMKVLANLANERSELIPDVETAKEQGIDMGLGFEKCFFTIFPKGTPAEIYNVFNKAVKQGIETEEAKEGLAKLYGTANYMDSEKTVEFLDDLMAYYSSMKDALQNDKF